MFENRVLRRIFGPKWDEVSGEWRKLHNEELNDLSSPLNIIRVIKSRMRWAGHVARMRRGEASTGSWWGNVKERDKLGDPDVVGDPDVHGRIILRCIFRKWDVGVWTGSSWLRIGAAGGLLCMW